MADLGHGPMIMGLVWALTGVATIAVGMRFYLRIQFLDRVGSEDWIMLVALALQIVGSAMLTVSFHYGLGMHDADMTIPQLVEVLKWIWLQTVAGILVSILARISIIILLVRIFGKRTWFKWFLYATGIVQTGLGIALIPVIFAQCTPVQGLWNPTIDAQCWDPSIQQDLAYSVQSFFTLGDLTYVIFPCFFVYKLNMSAKTKIGLILVLALGLFTMAASILKVTYVSSQSKAAGSQYNASIAVLWAFLEQLFVIIMGCIPPLRAIGKLEAVSYIKSYMSSITSLGSHGSSKQSASAAQSSPDYAAKNETKWTEEDGPEKFGSMASTTYNVSSVHALDRKPSSTEDGTIHKAVDFTVARDQHSV